MYRERKRDITISKGKKLDFIVISKVCQFIVDTLDRSEEKITLNVIRFVVV